MARILVKATEHVVVNGTHIWPDDADDANRKAGRRVEAEVDESALRQFGKALIKVGSAKEAETPADKQVGGSPRTK